MACRGVSERIRIRQNSFRSKIPRSLLRGSSKTQAHSPTDFSLNGLVPVRDEGRSHFSLGFLVGYDRRHVSTPSPAGYLCAESPPGNSTIAKTHQAPGNGHTLLLITGKRVTLFTPNFELTDHFSFLWFQKNINEEKTISLDYEK